ncbi:MAG: PfkB family carbohydrate kinase [Synergistaceae bacterium]|nr:PfkB family carbohydrate kinase [Synergistaceae bacterium]
MKTDTAVIGTVFVDCKGFAAYRYDPLGRNVGKVKFIHGGVGRNVAENLATAGLPVTFVSSVDDNALGHEILQRLNDKGADTRYTESAEAAGMGIWLAVMDQNGELASSISQMPDLTILEKTIDEFGDEIISRTGSVVLELDLNEKISGKVLELAKKYSKPVYGITGNMEVVLKNREFLRNMECYICNDVEAGRLFERDLTAFGAEDMLDVLVKGASRLGVTSMVITMGEKGSVYYDARAREKGCCPALPTDVVDSSGAGDAFFSGTVVGLIHGLTLAEAVEYGTHLASWTIQVEAPTCESFPGKNL